jgi:hypothetical protein
MSSRLCFEDLTVDSEPLLSCLPPQVALKTAYWIERMRPAARRTTSRPLALLLSGSPFRP